ncbi:hypothetical protein QR680_018458 [Steinernema hermaphroditum]|uniref:Uncharacterized protein n=1 Tax=Steinernema hermaphroditum TaxID=289476 RepID=A0AA39HI12_9BILA|nr:hypothetical protein QR680_018458 [Steinernema hermaphroditum]
MKFSGKVAIITGSTSGIGQATALLLAAEGAKVVIHGRSAEKIEATLKMLKEKGVRVENVLAIQGEIQDDKLIEYLVERTVIKFGKIDILINNAGLGGAPKMDPASMKSYDLLQDVNVKSVIKLTNLVLPYLQKTKGNIVNVSSVLSYYPAPTLLYYAMSKAALDHYMRSSVETFAKKGVRINNINPGYIKTDFLSQMDVPADIQQHLANTYNTIHPLGRGGVPSDVAKPIAFLASDDAGYVNGITLTVDGGQALKTNLTHLN